jgi:hypothetical protein
MSLNQDEKFAFEFLESKKLNVKLFSEIEKSEKGKTPDFKVDSNDGFFFYCEVKSIYIETSDDGILFQTINNNIANKVKEAYDQFNSVNPSKLVPNVLIIKSHNFQINYSSFISLVKGVLEIDNEVISDFHKYRDGRAKEAFREIDLFIFFNHNTPYYFLNNQIDHYTNNFVKIFEIKNIDKIKVS